MKMTVLRSSGFAALLLAPLFPARAVTSIAVSNPSFQADNFGTFPGYLGGANPSSITGWTATGGAGINGTDLGAGTPFADNGVIPDGNRAAFIQGAGSLSQTLSGFTVGQRYIIQGYANARGCCDLPPGTPGIPAVSLSIGGSSLLSTQPLTPVGGTNSWYVVSLPWVATATSVSLDISSLALQGDATAVFDAISVFQLNADHATLINPSFEAGGTAIGFPGYVDRIAGWDRAGTGSVGYNYAGNSAFNDLGAVPEGQAVAFLQNDMTLSQTVSGLTAGATYAIDFRYNSRDFGDNAWLVASVGGNSLLDAEVVPDAGWHTFSGTFTAGGASALVSFRNDVSHGQSDATLLLDNVNIRLVPEPGSVALLALGALGAVRRRR